MKLTKLYPTISKLCLRMALLRIILACYRQQLATKRMLPMDFWLDRIYEAFHSSNNVYLLLRRSYIPRIDPRSAKAVKGGKTLSVVPYGYSRINLANGDTKIIKIKKEADVIKLMFEFKQKGELTDVDIFKRVKEIGYPHRHVSSVSQTLLNPIYAGKYRYNGELIQGDHEPIVSDEVFFEVSEKILSRRKDLESRPAVRLFPLKQSVKLKEGLRSLNGSYGARNYLYYRDTLINVPKSFNIKLHQFHAMFKGFLLQNLPAQLKWIKQNQDRLHEFFIENADKLDLINENEIINTNGQYSQVKDLYQMDLILGYLKERLDAFLQVRALIREFRDKEKFDKALSEEISRASGWDSETYESQIEIQRLLFPHGLLFDEDIHQFFEVK